MEKIDLKINTVAKSILALTLSGLLIGCGGGSSNKSDDISNELPEALETTGFYFAEFDPYDYDSENLTSSYDAFEVYKISFENGTVKETKSVFDGTTFTEEVSNGSGGDDWYLTSDGWVKSNDNNVDETYVIENGAFVTTNSAGIINSYKPTETTLTDQTFDDVFDIYDGGGATLPSDLGEKTFSSDAKAYTFTGTKVTDEIKIDIYNSPSCPAENCNYLLSTDAEPATTFDDIFSTSENSTVYYYNDLDFTLLDVDSSDEIGVVQADIYDAEQDTYVDVEGATWSYKTINGEEVIVIALPDGVSISDSYPDAQVVIAKPDDYIRVGRYVPAGSVETQDDSDDSLNEAAINDIKAGLIEHFFDL